MGVEAGEGTVVRRSGEEDDSGTYAKFASETP